METSRQEDLSMATEVQLRREGKRDSSAIVQELCDFSPRKGTTIKKARKRFSSPKQNPFIANLRARTKTEHGKIIEKVCELLDIRAPAPIDQDTILSESSDTEESENDLEESDLDSE
ncbi:hypothetical protein AVEN_254851-1 [Araneus ventricosus]|uniref:Uncharacterized protein n=1 Tax=Araneus ventricosus TaxID=182803 RepID=A0A4Y2N677_ARAVE|nr:hypothetical protein AVEN_254851-1 [Araneus ventricosus]